MKAVFDTNILIDYLNGSAQAKTELGPYSEKVISIITWMEVMVGAKNEDEKRVLHSFLRGFTVIPLSYELAELGVHLRQRYKLKLPDAIIYATARAQGYLFVTRNTKDFDPSQPDVRVPYSL